MEDVTIKIYCDGACLGNPGIGAWAYRVEFPNGMVLEHGRSLTEETTNNRTELMAVIQAVKFITDRVSPVVIYSDSLYVIQGVNERLGKWAARGWTEIKNVELWQELHEVISQKPDISWQWIKGHSGHDSQERVDQLAQDLAKGRAVQFMYGKPMSRPPAAFPAYLVYHDNKLSRYQSWDGPEGCMAAVKGKRAQFKKVKSTTEEEMLLRSWGLHP